MLLHEWDEIMLSEDRLNRFIKYQTVDIEFLVMSLAPYSRYQKAHIQRAFVE